MEKNIYRALQVFFGLTAVYITFFSGSDRYYLGPVSLLFLLIPPVAERLFRLRLGDPMKIMIVAFCYLGYSLGTALRWFDRGFGFDNFVHGLSGILFTAAGLCFYGKISGSYDRTQRRLLQISYAFFFSMCVAVFWEIGEFTGYLLTGHDSQHHLDTGVFDTMEDMIACVVGSLVTALDYLVYTRRGGSLIMKAVLAYDGSNRPS